MSGITLSFDASPIMQHMRGLGRLAESNFVSARREIGEYLLGNVQDNIDHQRLFDGSAMPPSKAAQDRQPRWKRDNKKLGRVKGGQRGDTEKTLLDKHHLYDSYNPKSGMNLVAGGVEVGSGLVYAAIHHFGGETGRPGHRFQMTARPVLGVSAMQERAIGDFLLAEIARLP